MRTLDGMESVTYRLEGKKIFMLPGYYFVACKSQFCLKKTISFLNGPDEKKHNAKKKNYF